ncbi:MAG: aspartyl/glutamyl-tRNA(Asn/Gln) amidotransferase subunit B [Acidimicrobiia bacterium]|nr:MAG: aspartyl/glutamyl-tRNA(Asn/Gln) amidotransferase subunit B [Acidimicrobiia bacterium]
MTAQDWETVVGLEVHVELSTASKLFCGCANEFGGEPNTNVCPVCLGLPGSLPVLNERAVEYALRVAEALHLEVPPVSVFARKNYFYPDMPKNYQTSQYDMPITVHGWLDVDGARIGITRAHLEEDTGKTLHVGGGGRIHDADHALVDYNRAGVPLLEIVSEPDIRSAEQAKRYVEELRATLLAIQVSDVKMEEGSLRIDANVSVRPAGSDGLGTRCEIKNLNSLRSLVKAIEHEARRQVTAIEFGDAIVQETRHWDEQRGRTVAGRSKEEAHDYRYFPEPDLVPVAPTPDMREHVRRTLPELPAARRRRLVEAWGIRDDDARVLVATPGLADYAEKAVAALAGGTPREVVNWVRQEVLAYLNETGLSPSVLAPEMLAELVGLVAAGTISRNQAKDVLDESLREERWPRDIVEARGLAQVSDAGELAAVVASVLDEHRGVVEEYRGGDDKARKKKRGFLMGELMKRLQGKGNPQVLNRLLDEQLG